jgi:hypothetical protein
MTLSHVCDSYNMSSEPWGTPDYNEVNDSVKLKDVYNVFCHCDAISMTQTIGMQLIISKRVWTQ